MPKVGDRLALAILGLCAGGTFVALSLTSIAKKAGKTGPPPKPDMPWLQERQAGWEERLKALDLPLPLPKPGGGSGGGSSGSGSGGSGSGSGSGKATS